MINRCGAGDGSGNSEWLRSFRRKAAAQRVPVSGMIELNRVCNLDCLHCYVDRSSCVDLLSTGEVFRVLDEAAEMGCLYLTLTGGEPLMRPDFCEIYAHSRKLGMVVSVFSNGTLITGEIIDLFRRYPPRVVEVPVYGAGPEVHDAVTAVPGSFARVDANIRRMLHAGVKVGLKTVLMQNNARHVEAIEAYAEALSVPFRVDPLLFHPFGKDPERVESLRLTAEESVRLELGSVRRREQWLAYASPRSEWPPPERLYTCGAGVTSFHIDAEGGLSPCLMSTYERVDLRKVSFGEAWEVLASFARRPAPELYPCRQCDVHVYCTGCAAMNRLENGDETKVAEYVCDMAKVRAGMLNLPSTEQGYRYEKQRG